MVQESVVEARLAKEVAKDSLVVSLVPVDSPLMSIRPHLSREKNVKLKEDQLMPIKTQIWSQEWEVLVQIIWP